MLEHKYGAIFTFPETRCGESEQIAMAAIGLLSLAVLPRVAEGTEFPQLPGGEVTMYAVIGHTLVALGHDEEFVSLSIVQEGDQHRIRMLFRDVARLPAR